MSIRAVLNKSPIVIVVLALAMIAVAAWVTYKNVAPPPALGRGVYFTDDDGKTYFAGEMGDLSPMQHNGKTAYRAYIYKCADGKPFVGMLERMPDELVTLLRKAKSSPDSITDQEKGRLMLAGQMKQVKKPGEEKWKQAGPIGPGVACGDGKPAEPVE